MYKISKKDTERKDIAYGRKLKSKKVILLVGKDKNRKYTLKHIDNRGYVILDKYLGLNSNKKVYAKKVNASNIKAVK